jgi:hypothetical protein
MNSWCEKSIGVQKWIVPHTAKSTCFNGHKKASQQLGLWVCCQHRQTRTDQSEWDTPESFSVLKKWVKFSLVWSWVPNSWKIWIVIHCFRKDIWLVVYFSIGNFIIPTDQHIFQRAWSTTNQISSGIINLDPSHRCAINMLINVFVIYHTYGIYVYIYMY